MRLTCPNCSAQYEVDDAVIPEEGRDVQCSNCAHIWVQLPADGGAASAPPGTSDAPGPAPQPEAGGGEGTRPGAGDDSALEGSEPALQRREIDASVLEILREEAAREQRARLADAGAAGVPDDSGPAGMAAVTEPPPPARRADLLPDIDEINSSLDPDAGLADAAARRAARRGGFLMGLALVACLAAVALGLYMAAPRIAALHPALDAVMADYVTLIDGARAWLNTVLPEKLGALKAMATNAAD